MPFCFPVVFYGLVSLRSKLKRNVDDFNIIFYGPECPPEELIDESQVSKTINGSQPPRPKWIAKHAEISGKTPLNGFDNLGTINPNQVVLAFHNYLCTDDCEVFIEPSQLEVLNTAMETGDPNLYLESALCLAFDADIKEDEYKQIIAPAIKALNNKLLNLNKKPYLYQNIEINKAKRTDNVAIPEKTTPPESITSEPVISASEPFELLSPESKKVLLALPKGHRRLIELLLRRAERLTRFKQRYQRKPDTNGDSKTISVGEIVLIIMAILLMIGVSLYRFTTVIDQGVYQRNTSDSRKCYTMEQINSGILDDMIVLNSVIDGPFGDERYFVDASPLDDNGLFWFGDSIKVEDEKTYVIRLDVQNDNPRGLDAIAEDVRAMFSLPTTVGKTHTIKGYLESSNAESDHYEDSVVLYSDHDFYIQYLEGSARYSNDPMGEIQLSDDVITSGVPLGYDRFDGKIPGGQKYKGVVTIEVKVHRTVSSKLSMEARLKGTKHWTEEVFANAGDEIEMRIEYKNLTAEEVHDVMIRDVLPDNLQYVPQSTYLYNANYPDGVLIDEQTVTTSGINIGNYDALKDAYIQFSCVVVDISLKKLTQLVNWASATVNGEVFKDDVSIMVDK